MATNLPPTQLAQYQQQRNDYGQKLLSNKAGNVYQQQLGNIRFGRQRNQFNQMWDQRRTQLPMSFLQRGLGRSGIYAGALQNYARDRASGLADLLLSHQLEQSGLTFQDRGFEDEYARAMAANYGRQYASQADIAAALRGVL